ncbi:4'-phosphopantetheinyl transferase superfamily protein [Desulfococcaceae bacterium HSG9]|nr:4'-phosphopantetheinyl transferase superfamily protein [Desulfococcaceae bacterium HSG9]
MPLYKKRTTLKLVPGEIHLWLVFSDEIREASLFKAYNDLMTSEERVRGRRFRFARHQRQFAVTRALVRTTLSRYSHIKPHQWRFDKNPYGRPEIKTSQNSLGLQFNLSHTNGLIVCAVTQGASKAECAIGVDVESIERKGATIEIADRFFSNLESADLRNIPEKDRRLRFFDYWTLKEAYIKACGMGLSIPLKQFSFHITHQEPLSISFAPELKDDPRCWQFWLLNPTQHHRVALAVRLKQELVCQLILKKVTPLSTEQSFECPFWGGV